MKIIQIQFLVWIREQCSKKSCSRVLKGIMWFFAVFIWVRKASQPCKIQIMAGNGEVRIKRELEEDPLSLEICKLHVLHRLYILPYLPAKLNVHTKFHIGVRSFLKEILFLYTSCGVFAAMVFQLGSIHIWRQMFLGNFWPTYLPSSDTLLHKVI